MLPRCVNCGWPKKDHVRKGLKCKSRVIDARYSLEWGDAEMNGGVTVIDMEERKRKAAEYDRLMLEAASNPPEQNMDITVDLAGCARMLRRGMRAIYRQEWEAGETAQEWYSNAGTLAAAIDAQVEDGATV